MKRTLAFLLAVTSLVAAPISRADGSTPATPAPTIGTGGNVSGSDQGSTCQSRLPVRYFPAESSNPYAWAEPDWPGFFTEVFPTPTPASCSR